MQAGLFVIIVSLYVQDVDLYSGIIDIVDNPMLPTDTAGICAAISSS